MAKNTKTKALLLIATTITFVAISPVQAQKADMNGNPAEKGLAIATEMKSRDTGWVDTTADVQMILRDARGQEFVNEIRVRSLEVEDEGDKALTIFDQPRDVAGTAFLSFSKTHGADDQWIFLPAVKRVKRIATRNKSGPFMGSEFAFEDMTSFELEKFTFKFLNDDMINGMPAFVVEQRPTYEYSGYTRQVAWVDKEHYRVHKIEFYDRKDALLKILQLSNYKQYLDKYWRALRSDMDNLQTGKSTTLLTSDMSFKTGLDEGDFDKNALRRVR